MPKDYKLSAVEQETLISFNRRDSKANIFTLDPDLMEQLEPLPGAHEFGAGVEVEIPKRYIKIDLSHIKKSSKQLGKGSLHRGSRK